MLDVTLHSQSGAPLVTVVMTTYNGERFIAEQIESILRQSYSNFELIIADDASTDGTVNTLLRFSNIDKRLRLIINASNIGIHTNLENALSEAKGEYIAISDQDDIWDSKKLEVLIENMGDRAAIYSNSLLVDESGLSIGLTLMQRLGIRSPACGDQAILLLRKNCVSGHALMFRRQLLTDILPFYRKLMYDLQIGFVAALNGGLGYVDVPLVSHRIHDGNQNNNGLKISHSPRRTLRVDRYRRQNLEMAEKLKYLIAYCGRQKALSRAASCSPELLHRAPEIVCRLENFDRTWFDFRLFLILLRVRADLFAGDGKGVFRRCMKYARGARFYARERADKFFVG